MAIPGMMALIRNKADLMSTVDLMNTKLIVDAEPVLFWLFQDFTKNFSSKEKQERFGTNLPMFGQHLRILFDSFKDCKIEPIVVYEGTRLPESTGLCASKLGLMIDVASDTFDRLKKSQTKIRDTLIPPIALLVFKSIVIEYKYETVQCINETYPHLTRLSNQYICPVLTGNSDYILQDASAGFILIDHLELGRMQKNRQDQMFIPSPVYYHQRFLKNYTFLNSQTAALLYVLLRPDFAKDFSIVLDRVMGTNPNKKTDTITNRDLTKKIVNYLKFFSGKTLEQAKELLNCGDHGSRSPAFMNQLEAILPTYTQSRDLVESLESLFAKTVDPSKPAKYIKNILEKSGHSSALLLDILYRQTILAPIVIEDYRAARPVNAIMDRPISLLLPFLRSSSFGTSASTIRAFDRQGDKLMFRPIEAMKFLQGFGGLDRVDITTLLSLDISGNSEAKASLVFGAFNVNKFDGQKLAEAFKTILNEELANEAAIIVILLRFSFDETKLYEDKEFRYSTLRACFIRASIGCIIYYAIKNNQLRENYSKNLIQPHQKLVDMVTSKTMDKPKQQPRNVAYIRTMHLVSMLHAAIIGYDLVNTMAGFPCPVLHLDKYLDGVLIYNLTQWIHTKAQKPTQPSEQLVVIPKAIEQWLKKYLSVVDGLLDSVAPSRNLKSRSASPKSDLQ